ncbi:MAG: helix-turn-helix domain-containing protein [Candidatus Helarchaeota archaeon]
MVNDDNSLDRDELIEQLMKFDLSREEAEIYLLLLEYKSMIVRDLNKKIPQIQRTYLYNYLDKLSRSGWVHINTVTKPQSYNPYTPEEVLLRRIEEKKEEIKKIKEDFDELMNDVYPDLLKKLNSLYLGSWNNISSNYIALFKEYFKDLPIRVENAIIEPHSNPYLNFFLPVCNFHGFFIAHHKKPISDEYLVHFYEFETSDFFKESFEFLELIFSYRVKEMVRILARRESLKEIMAPVPRTRNIEGLKINIEDIRYQKGESELTAFLVHPFLINKRNNILMFMFANKKKNGEKLLEWIIKRFKAS